jgi:hypothetical protein
MEEEDTCALCDTVYNCDMCVFIFDVRCATRVVVSGEFILLLTRSDGGGYMYEGGGYMCAV